MAELNNKNIPARSTNFIVTDYRKFALRKCLINDYTKDGATKSLGSK